MSQVLFKCFATKHTNKGKPSPGDYILVTLDYVTLE